MVIVKMCPKGFWSFACFVSFRSQCWDESLNRGIIGSLFVQGFARNGVVFRSLRWTVSGCGRYLGCVSLAQVKLAEPWTDYLSSTTGFDISVVLKATYPT